MNLFVNLRYLILYSLTPKVITHNLSTVQQLQLHIKLQITD